MSFESGVEPEDWRSAVIVTLYKGKRERSECKSYRSISFFSEVGKIYAGILVDRVHRVIGGFINDKQGGIRSGIGCVDQNFILKQIDEKAREKKCRVYVGFIDREKAYDRVNSEALWQVMGMYDVGAKFWVELKVHMLIVQFVSE